MNRLCRLLHGQPRQPFEWNYFPLLNGRIVLSYKKRNLRKYSVAFFLKHFPKKWNLANPIELFEIKIVIQFWYIFCLCFYVMHPYRHTLLLNTLNAATIFRKLAKKKTTSWRFYICMYEITLNFGTLKGNAIYELSRSWQSTY